MSEGCRELCRDLTTHSHQSSTMLCEGSGCPMQLKRAERNASNPQAYLTPCLTRIRTSLKTKAKGLSCFSFMLPQSFPPAPQLPPTNRSWKCLLIKTMFFKRWQKIVCSYCCPLWSCAWLCLFYTWAWWVCSAHLQNLPSCSPAPLAMSPGQHSDMTKAAWNWSTTTWKRDLRTFFFFTNIM